jgi:hypothetical protein
MLVAGSGVLLADAGEAVGAAGREAALDGIFGADRTTDSALGIHMRAGRMAAGERFEYLKRQVLPAGDHRLLRVEVGFTAIHPAAAAELAGPVDEDELQAGSNVVSPAIDLIVTGQQLGRLDEIRDALADWQPDSVRLQPVQQQKAVAALRMLLAIAEQDFETAADEIQRIFELASQHPVIYAERGPEAIGMWVGSRYPQTREAARDLTLRVYEQARNQQGPRRERWHRHVYALKSRFDRDAESSETAGQFSDSEEQLKNWTPVSRMTAGSRGLGFPEATWDTTHDGYVRHASGHDHDYLYYSIPLTGNFRIDATLTTFDYRDIHLGMGSYWAGPGYDLKACLCGDFRRDFASQRIDPPLGAMFDWMDVRIEVRDGMRTTFINGREVYSREHPEGSDPWLAVHSAWYAHGSVKHLRVSGNPQIPAEIKLAELPELPGWLPYYDEEEGVASARSAGWRLDMSRRRATNFAGLFAQPVASADESQQHVLVGDLRTNLAGTHKESLLRYHRPMLEDGTIEYEFYYSPGSHDVHPALDRLCFMLKPEGVGVHWATDSGFDATETDPANLVYEVENKRGSGPLPLTANAWNKASLSLAGDTVELRINQQLVYSRVLEPGNQRTFGLFHYADQTEARVRGLRWRGHWPDELPAAADQELSDEEVPLRPDDTETLPIVLQHDFAEGLPRQVFTISGSGWQDHFEQLEDGIRLTRPEGSYANYLLSPHLTLQGDFDIIAEFEDLETSAEVGGESNIQLRVTLDDDTATTFRLYRKEVCHATDRSHQLVQAAVFKTQKGHTGFDFPKSPPQESKAGRLRLIRRGQQMHYLYAENDSSQYRLIHSEPASAVDTATAGIKLGLEQHKAGAASVTWKSLTIRAESAGGMATHRIPSLEELDQQRDQLQAVSEYDFSENPNLDQLVKWGGSQGTFVPADQGLQIESPGTEQWSAVGLAPRLELHGDFDVSLDLDIQEVDTPPDGQNTIIYLQAEFQDPANTKIETKHAVIADGRRLAEVHLIKNLKQGGSLFQELNAHNSKSVGQLRLARRGDVGYLLYQEAGEQEAEIMGQAVIGRYPVPSTFLRALIHTGGANYRTTVLFRRLSIHAERIESK